jgi:hypothetical protein
MDEVPMGASGYKWAKNVIYSQALRQRPVLGGQAGWGIMLPVAMYWGFYVETLDGTVRSNTVTGSNIKIQNIQGPLEVAVGKEIVISAHAAPYGGAMTFELANGAGHTGFAMVNGSGVTSFENNGTIQATVRGVIPGKVAVVAHYQVNGTIDTTDPFEIEVKAISLVDRGIALSPAFAAAVGALNDVQRTTLYWAADQLALNTEVVALFSTAGEFDTAALALATPTAQAVLGKPLAAQFCIDWVNADRGRLEIFARTGTTDPAKELTDQLVGLAQSLGGKNKDKSEQEATRTGVHECQWLRDQWNGLLEALATLVI